MKLNIVQWNNITQALMIAQRVLREEAKGHDRNTVAGKQLSDQAYKEAYAMEELHSKIMKEGLS